MIRSMTGFGRAELERDGWSCGVEMRSVNSRFLEVRIRLPNPLAHHEEQYKREIRKHCERGKLECTVVVNPTRDDGAGYTVNTKLAQQYGTLIKQLQEALGVKVNISFTDLLNNKQLVGSPDLADEQADIEQLVADTIAQALDGLNQMRSREGEAIHQDLTERVAELRKMLDQIVPLTESIPAAYAARLREKLALLVDGESVPNEDRILQEIALYTDRCDVSEEITRFRAHLEHLMQLMEDSGPQGRKIEFLLQELNREANTLSVKSNSAPISEFIIEMKAELERLREQIQNIE